LLNRAFMAMMGAGSVFGARVGGLMLGLIFADILYPVLGLMLFCVGSRI
jgi:uncharacterized membrane protein YfcA